MTTETQRLYFSESMKLADLVDVNFKLLNVLSRLGIGLGFGELTIREVCSRQDINLSSFLIICNVYTYDSYMPSAELMAEADPETIIDYLQGSHTYYLNKEFPALERNLADMASPCSDRQKKIVSKFFADYKEQVVNHFAYEEDVVFPYVRALRQGKVQGGYTIEQFEENHSNIDETLNDLKTIVMKYLPETCDTVMRNEVLYRIYRLEEDLARHTVIEDTVLIPMVNKMEA